MFSVLSSILVVSLAAQARADDARPTDDYLLHLPGIAGYHWIDRQMLAGLRDGGFVGESDVRDWPGDAPGLAALFARKRNHEQARGVADAIVSRLRQHLGTRVVLTAHSGGAGVGVWALEKLPDGVQVDTVVLLAPALSPEYDLTAALKHVRGKMYAFTSTLDAIVLGAGTSTFGTIDGVKCEAAGLGGFVMPEGADEKQYQKLVQMPYESKWMREGNIGDHIGPMGYRFARNVLAPLVTGHDLTADPTRDAASDSTRDATREAKTDRLTGEHWSAKAGASSGVSPSANRPAGSRADQHPTSPARKTVQSP